MAVPAKPTVPALPLRTQPSTFPARADAWLTYLAGPHQTFIRDIIDSAHAAAQAAEDATDAGSMADVAALLSGHGDQSVLVNEAGDGLELRPRAETQIASQAEAEAGEITGKVMSPLRTRQAMEAVAAVSPWARIVTKTANNASLDFTEFDENKYIDYMFRIRNLLPVADATNIKLRPSDDGGITQTAVRSAGAVWRTSTPLDLTAALGTAVDETGFSGILTLFALHEPKGCMYVVFGVEVSFSSGVVGKREGSGLLQRPSVDSAVNHIRFTNTGSGSITLYGRRI